jgi:hypothetical protein
LHRETSTFAFVVGQDYHYSVALGASLRLVLDPAASLGTMRFNFGALFAEVTAAAAHLFHVTTFGGWVRLIQIGQIVFLLCALGSAWLFERSRRYVLAVALTVAPWASTMNQDVVAPTSSGLRFLNFALLPLALTAMKGKRAGTAAAIGGLCGALALLWNPETGIACTAVFTFFVFLTAFANGGALIKPLGLTALTVVIALLGGGGSLLLLLGGTDAHWLFLQHLIEHVNGYNGHPLPFEPIAIIAALYASALVIYTCLAVRAGEADDGVIARGALAAGAVVWFAYYVHSPSYAHLYSVVLLLCFTLAPLLAAPTRWAPALIALVIAGVNVQEIVTLPARFGLAQPTFQGIVLPADAANYLDAHAAALMAAPADIVYFASTPFSMALASGRTNPLPIFDPFGETWTYDAFNALMQTVAAKKPACILVEQAGSPLLAVNLARAQFMQRVEKSVPAGYGKTRSDGGWDFWCRPAS